MNTALKKKSLEESLSGHTSGTIESERRVETVGEGKFGGVLDQYREFLDRNFITDGDLDVNAWVRIRDQIKTVLSPAEINTFLQSTITNEDHSYYLLNTSIFLSGLIQTSYNDGNSLFDLNVQNLRPLSAMGAFLSGSQEQPLSVRVKGDVGTHLGVSSNDVKFYLDGDTNYYCGDRANNSEFYVSGNVGVMTGFCSSNCLFDLKSRVENIHLVNEKGSTVLISDRESFEIIRKKYTAIHAEALKYNNIYFVHPDGHKELLVVGK